jgi:hypothetical protein
MHRMLQLMKLALPVETVIPNRHSGRNLHLREFRYFF